MKASSGQVQSSFTGLIMLALYGASFMYLERVRYLSTTGLAVGPCCGLSLTTGESHARRSNTVGKSDILPYVIPPFVCPFLRDPLRSMSLMSCYLLGILEAGEMPFVLCSTGSQSQGRHSKTAQKGHTSHT